MNVPISEMKELYVVAFASIIPFHREKQRQMSSKKAFLLERVGGRGSRVLLLCCADILHDSFA